MGSMLIHGVITPNAFHYATNALGEARAVGVETETLSNLQTEKFKFGTIYVTITTHATVKKKSSKWIHSQAKTILHDIIIHGIVDAQMAPMAVY